MRTVRPWIGERAAEVIAADEQRGIAVLAWYDPQRWRNWKEELLSSPAPIVSARSQETEDTCIVDLAVGWQAPLIKVGSIARGERTAKRNRGLRIHQAHPMPLMRFPHPGSHSQH